MERERERGREGGRERNLAVLPSVAFWRLLTQSAALFRRHLRKDSDIIYIHTYITYIKRERYNHNKYLYTIQYNSRIF